MMAESEKGSVKQRLATTNQGGQESPSNRAEISSSLCSPDNLQVWGLLVVIIA